MQIRDNADLSSFNTMGVKASARYLAEVNSRDELTTLMESKNFRHLDKMVLGGGSNILFKNDYDGLIILNKIKGIRVVEENPEEIVLEIGAGENWHELVMYCVERGWGGIENLSLIPGSVGAAPIQNIGAYGVELEEVFVQLEAFLMEEGQFRIFKKEECNFGYRDSIFKQELKSKVVITSVVLKLNKKPEAVTAYRALEEKLEEKGITSPTIKEISEAVIEIRQSKLPDPAEIGNTGSFFKNPVVDPEVFARIQKEYPDIPHYPAGDQIKIPAAWLIDTCGWKGRREGDAGVHEMQALVIVNYGNATGQEIWALAEKIRASVKEQFGIALVPEVNVV